MQYTAILFIPLQNSHLPLRALGEHDSKDTISHQCLDSLFCVNPGWEIDLASNDALSK